jgi:hypothetical protein
MRSAVGMPGLLAASVGAMSPAVGHDGAGVWARRDGRPNPGRSDTVGVAQGYRSVD